MAPSSHPHDSFIVATAGHVDHGKTALIKALTGVDTDTLEEEKSRGLSINLGFAYAHWPLPGESDSRQCTLGFIDVPGHRDFIHNMLAGVSAIDAALIVVAADDGIMPQTREHLSILQLLNVERAVVAITKSDLVKPEKLSGLEQELRSVLAGSSLDTATYVITSCLHNIGITDLRQRLLALAAEKSGRSNAAATRYFRYQIDRSFSVKGIGTVVTGTTIAGQTHTEAHLTHSRSGTVVRVRGLRLDKDQISHTTAIERAAINISALSREELKRGDWLLDEALRYPVFRFDGHLRWLSALPPKQGVLYHLHIGAAHHLVSVRQLGSADSHFFQLRSQEPLFCHYGDRFILRDPTGTMTLGGGMVVDRTVPRRKRASAERLRLLTALNCPDDRQALGSALEVAISGVDLPAFGLCRNITPAGMDQILAALKADGIQTTQLSTRRGDTRLFLRSHFETIARKLLASVTQFHRREPDKPGVDEATLFKLSEFSDSASLFQAMVDKLLQLQLLQKTGGNLHLPEHQPQANPEDILFARRIHPLLAAAGRIPPRTHELVEQTGLSLQQVEAVLKQACRNNKAIRVADNRHFLPETLDDLARFTKDLAAAQADGGFSVIQFRDASGIGRNLCIEILEHFDRTGLTRRMDNLRYLRRSAEQQ